MNVLEFRPNGVISLNGGHGAKAPLLTLLVVLLQCLAGWTMLRPKARWRLDQIASRFGRGQKKRRIEAPLLKSSTLRSLRTFRFRLVGDRSGILALGVDGNRCLERELMPMRLIASHNHLD